MDEELVSVLSRQKVLPIIRTDNVQRARELVSAYFVAGARAIELTTTIPDVWGLLEEVRDTHPDLFLGLGTVRTKEQAERAMARGARFLVTYFVADEVAAAARDSGVPFVLGALTPTEVERAMALGSTVVKIFPASAVGPAFIRELRGPRPEVQCVPTGGIRPEDVGAWLQAGALAVGIGSALARREPGEADDAGITERLRALLKRWH
ncbi:MAG: bifunctional 4-hydroxy-2-oxoglutarate aldolase/2-dehydro-3-deoxy-phosphogluconate aldolase [Firmicutes bacterium]|nr:bifunctional 4-hydroxy-2-oxoglutarate aldolase/2-dehydro-3-deoxy-phosphogluconate aldolase [Bacillota bacterium]